MTVHPGVLVAAVCVVVLFGPQAVVPFWVLYQFGRAIAHDQRRMN
jgi:hypothetical protein